MASEEHVAILKQGVEVWNEWREKNQSIKPDLAGTQFSEANLIGVNLSGAYLSGANFSMANLSEANLGQALLGEANLRCAELSNAYLNWASFREVDLREAKLHNADLMWVNFYRTNLSGADLSYAGLGGANLFRADLVRADFTAAQLLRTIFTDVDLSQVKGLEAVDHRGPSTIGIDTIYKSGGNIPEIFLRGAGVPDDFITFMKSLTGSAFDFYSCFISHSSKDREFVERLYADLQSNGVRCWYAPEDLKIGEPFLLGIDQGIRLHDKLLLVLSENSVGSGWVQHEVLSAMAKEQGKAPWVLFPIRLDDVVMKTDVHWANMIRQSRHVGDFTQWKDHDSYKKAFDRLLRDLKAKG